MTTATESQVSEDDSVCSSSRELFDNSLITIFNSPRHKYQIGLTPSKMLSEAYRMSERVEDELLNEKSYHQLYESAKNRLGTYHAASISMAMMYAILSCKTDNHFYTQTLLNKIEEKFRLRPWMDDVKYCIDCYKDDNRNSSKIKITVQINNKKRNMEDSSKSELLKGMFAGANFTNSVVVGVAEKGSNISYHANESNANIRTTDEKIAQALVAINGKGHAISDYQKWLGVCCLLSWKYGFPKNLQQCCEKIANLPYEEGKLELECKYESVRKFANYSFVKEDARNWGSYKPNETERALFYSSYDVAQEFDNALQNILD